MSDLAEVEAAVAAAREVVPDLPVIATLSFDTNLRTMMGVRPADAVTSSAALGVDAVGANCGRGPGEMQAIAESWPRPGPTGVLLVAQTNAGLPQLVGDRFEYDVAARRAGRPRPAPCRARRRPHRRRAAARRPRTSPRWAGRSRPD